MPSENPTEPHNCLSRSFPAHAHAHAHANAHITEIKGMQRMNQMIVRQRSNIKHGLTRARMPPRTEKAPHMPANTVGGAMQPHMPGNTVGGAMQPHMPANTIGGAMQPHMPANTVGGVMQPHLQRAYRGQREALSSIHVAIGPPRLVRVLPRVWAAVPLHVQQMQCHHPHCPRH